MSPHVLKLAVASKDGISINEHFGHAKHFWVYQVSLDSLRLLGKRSVEQYCMEHEGSTTAMENVIDTIKDCYAVFVAKIADEPADKLSVIGVHAVSDYAYAAVDESLRNFMQNKFGEQ